MIGKDRGNEGREKKEVVKTMIGMECTYEYVWGKQRTRRLLER